MDLAIKYNLKSRVIKMNYNLGKKKNRDSGMDGGNIKISNIQIIGILEVEKRENGTKAI